ncbi:MAG: hypothetical protein JNK84_12315 [Phreatobacter sp.]|uniref:hypothetical protein n=1 Tax=Phreatobacter sp. TaxID=1966341 RepID=UPI001A57FFB1|nr:hypothetical protein [Phreatobacter sp.]MBL8569851.1 hypothetical protein [Phreatobacter sp.]
MLVRILNVAVVCGLLVGVDYAVTGGDYTRAAWRQTQMFGYTVDRIFSRFKS